MHMYLRVEIDVLACYFSDLVSVFLLPFFFFFFFFFFFWFFCFLCVCGSFCWVSECFICVSYV